jgi:hypothetical protein
MLTVHYVFYMHFTIKMTMVIEVFCVPFCFAIEIRRASSLLMSNREFHRVGVVWSNPR